MKQSIHTPQTATQSLGIVAYLRVDGDAVEVVVDDVLADPGAAVWRKDATFTQRALSISRRQIGDVGALNLVSRAETEWLGSAILARLFGMTTMQRR